MSAILAVLAGYLIGSIPFAFVIARWRKGFDIRQVGSRNMGAMNVMYAVGPIYGLSVLILDFTKGVAAVLLARWLGDGVGIEVLAGTAAVLGHILPVFLRFKGGKGGATCIGTFFILLPWGIPVFYGVFGLLTLLTRFLTLSYSAAMLCFPFIAWLVYDSGMLILYTSGMLALLGLRYIPRLAQIRSASPNWRRALFRRSLKERL